VTVKQKLQRLELTCEEAEAVALDRQEWHRSVAQCINQVQGRGIKKKLQRLELTCEEAEAVVLDRQEWPNALIKFKVEASNCLL